MDPQKRFRITAAVLAAAALVFCGGFQATPQEPADEAKTIANLLEHHYHNAKTLRAVFLERYTEGPKDSRVESGTVYFKRPGMMRWEYDAPEKKLFIVDGKTAWFYVPYDRTVTKAPMKQSSDLRTPLALLTDKSRSLAVVQQDRIGSAAGSSGYQRGAPLSTQG